MNSAVNQDFLESLIVDDRKCSRCVLLKPQCLCSRIPSIRTRTRLSLVIQVGELRKTSNSGMLAALCLDNRAVYVRGLAGHVVDYRQVVDGEHANWLLFPGSDAERITPELVSSEDRPVNLIVPDGNWSQATRMYRQFVSDVPGQSYRTVQLPPGPGSEYLLRRHHHRPEGVATLEAIGRSFAHLESVEVEAQLLSIFAIKVERVLRARGQRP
ncbi:hypothetical protein ABI59_07530 [Acidobacteria bacterium Mor1]|nr:hypothetical protein ABI59_07530 [Acidobacteria bacterium Mor1]